MLANNFDIDDDDDEEEGGENWLTSYSDMMTDLLAVFVILFAFATMSTSYSNAQLKEQLQQATAQNSAASSTQATANAAGSAAEKAANSDFDKLYEMIKKKIDESGYGDSIEIEKTDEYINFRFHDGVLFLPDSNVVRKESYELLSYMGQVLTEVDKSVDSISIIGHVADVGAKSDFGWKLSSERAFAVLKYFVNDCGLNESKMTFSGRSYHEQIASNDTESGRSLNRRVEIKIIKKTVS